MPFEAMWYIPERVVYVRQWGTLTLDDAINTDAAIARYAAGQAATVHGIIESRDVEAIDINPRLLKEAFSKLPKPTEGWVVTVPGDRVSAFMTQLMAQSQQMKQRDFQTPEEALAFIVYMDESLANMPVQAIAR